MIQIGVVPSKYPTLYYVNKVVTNNATGSVRLQLSTSYSDKREMVTVVDGTTKAKKHYSNWNACYLVGDAKTKFLSEGLNVKDNIVINRGSITYESKFDETTQKWVNPTMPSVIIYDYEVHVWENKGLANEPDIPEEIVNGTTEEMPW